MLEGLPWQAIGVTASGWFLATLGVLLLFRGRLVTRTTVDDMINAHQQRLEDVEHDRDEWRAAHRISEQARLEEREHNAELLNDIANPLKGFLEGFRKAARSEVGNE